MLVVSKSVVSKIVIGVICTFPLAGCLGSSDDKARHFAAGGVASWAAQELGAPAWAGCAVALGAGLLKEHYDNNRGGHWDKDDALATVAGCSVTLVF